jgi:hypothetical protein
LEEILQFCNNMQIDTIIKFLSKQKTVVITKNSVFFYVTPVVQLKSTDVSEEHVTSIFRFED